MDFQNSGLIGSFSEQDLADLPIGEKMRLQCRQIAREAYKGQYRDTGEPYIIHPLEMEEIMGYILQPTNYKDIILCATDLHDVPEQGKIDGKPVEVFNPYSRLRPYSGLPRNFKEGFVYLNILLADFGKEGKMVCYIDDKITHRPNMKYMGYMEKEIFSLSRRRNLDIGKITIKIADRKGNTKPEEIIDEDFQRKRFNECQEKGELESLIKKYKPFRWASKCIAPERDISFDDFFRLMQEALIRKRLANAFDNVSIYLPKAEALLIKSAREKDKRLFYKDRLEDVIKECWYNSNIIIEKYKYDYLDEELIANLGNNRQ
ncbi:MAG: hypothetical protein NTY20_01250 [Candidatus Aenigmarchaeota archaeon]|nr:hypothetical protein [Candidatus Aenigmarchaeota archaeon]